MKTLINTLLLLAPGLIGAQDLLFKKDNSKLEVKVSEITETTVTYKLFTNQNGPNYVISKKDVALIIYKNGTHEVFNSPVKEEYHFNTNSFYSNDTMIANNKNKTFLKLTRTNSVIFLNAIEFLNSGVGVSYFREVYGNRFDIHVPIAASFDKPGLDNALNIFGGGNIGRISRTHYDIGLGLYYNTRAKSRVTHFIGPLVRNAQYSGTFNYSIPQEYYSGGEGTFTMNETSVLLNNGFLYRITPEFNMMINFAFGKFVNRSYSRGEIPKNAEVYGEQRRELAIVAGFHLGYRF
jgi:hypothetical protein